MAFSDLTPITDPNDPNYSWYQAQKNVADNPQAYADRNAMFAQSVRDQSDQQNAIRQAAIDRVAADPAGYAQFNAAYLDMIRQQSAESNAVRATAMQKAGLAPDFQGQHFDPKTGGYVYDDPNTPLSFSGTGGGIADYQKQAAAAPETAQYYQPAAAPVNTQIAQALTPKPVQQVNSYSAPQTNPFQATAPAQSQSPAPTAQTQQGLPNPFGGNLPGTSNPYGAMDTSGRSDPTRKYNPMSAGLMSGFGRKF